MLNLSASLVGSCGYSAIITTKSDRNQKSMLPSNHSQLVESDLKPGWLRGSVVERRSSAGVLSLSCARPVADG